MKKTVRILVLSAAVFWALNEFALPKLAYVFYPRWLQIALSDQKSVPDIGKIHWESADSGMETAQLDVFVGPTKVDRLHLVRLDPKYYRFEVHAEPRRALLVEEWQDSLGAAVVVNGSYFVSGGEPQTPLRSKGQNIGPQEYTSQHGAFVFGDEPHIIDLKDKVVGEEIERYSEAMVSYPLLIDAEGNVRAEGKANWLANRTFVAITHGGKVLFGVTEEGFFSLRRLALFLKHTEALEIRAALNLDGGPLVGQAVKGRRYRRILFGHSELNDRNGYLKPFYDELRSDRWKLPIVLAAIPRDS